MSLVHEGITDAVSKERIPLLSGSLVTSADDVTSGADIEDTTGFIHESVDHGNSHYSIWVAIIFVINYACGSGILAISYEFYQTGYILSTILLVWCGILTYSAMKMIANLMYRAETVTTIALTYGLPKSQFLDNPDIIISNLRDNITLADFVIKYDQFTRNEFELNQMVGLFCGKKWRVFYDITFILSVIVQLWSYNVAFAASLARFGGISGISDSCDIESNDYTSDCRVLYTLYSCVFYVWCLIVVLLDFTEQIGIQIITFVARIVIITLMVITSIGLMYGNLEYSSDTGDYTKRSDNRTPYYGNGVSAWNWDGLLYFVAVSIYAYTCQFCVPDVIEPLQASDRKNKLNTIFGISLFTLFVIWLCVGLTVSLYFGSDTEDPCTLAWDLFRGFVWNDGVRPDWSYFVAYMVLLLPVADLISSYPVNAITLCNTIEQAIFDFDRLQADPIYFKRCRIGVRVVVVTVCFVLGLLLWGFGTLVTMSGILSLLAVYMVPAYAEHMSQKMCHIITNDDTSHITPVTDWATNRFWIYAQVITSVVACVGVIVEWAT